MRIIPLILIASFVSAFTPPTDKGSNMSNLNPTGMNETGQFVIAAPNDIVTNTTPPDWNAASGLGQIANKPTAVSAFSNDAGYLTSSALASYITSSSLSATLASYATSSSLTSGLSGKQNTITTGTTAQYFRGDLSLATFPTIPSTARTTSTLSLSLVGTGATGTQISATKDSSIYCCVSTSTTSTIGGPATSIVALKICATNNASEGSWTSVALIESDQTITLAIVLQSIQVVKGQLYTDVPAGWYAKLVNSGTGTHSEAAISGQQTIYG